MHIMGETMIRILSRFASPALALPRAVKRGVVLALDVALCILSGKMVSDPDLFCFRFIVLTVLGRGMRLGGDGLPRRQRRCHCERSAAIHGSLRASR
jgi:hypothetical protein